MSDLSYRMLNIGSAPAGLLGLEELFAELFTQGITPTNEKLTEFLLAGVRKHNYIPKAALNDYAGALRMEYTRYYKRKQQGKAMVARDYGTWRGYPENKSHGSLLYLMSYVIIVALAWKSVHGKCLNGMKTVKYGWQSRFFVW